MSASLDGEESGRCLNEFKVDQYGAAIVGQFAAQVGAKPPEANPPFPSKEVERSPESKTLRQ